MILCLTILHFSLYDVKYKYIFNIKKSMRVRVHDLKNYLKKTTIFVHIHVKYIFTFIFIFKK